MKKLSMLIHNKLFRILILPVTVVLLYILLLFMAPPVPEHMKPPRQGITPAITIAAILTGPTGPIMGKTKPVVKVDSDFQKKLLNTLKERPELYALDEIKRQALIKTLNGKSGTLWNAADFRVDYLQTADVFMVQIKTTDIAGAKQEAINWFDSQGISKESVCKMPAVFYLRSDILEQLKPLNITFNPLADGC